MSEQSLKPGEPEQPVASGAPEQTEAPVELAEEDLDKVTGGFGLPTMPGSPIDLARETAFTEILKK